MEKKPQIVVVGGLNLDIQAKCNQQFLPADSNPGQCTHSAGGVGRNIAYNLVQLGAQVEYIAAIGDDVFSDWLLADCERIGIGMSAMIRCKDRTASQYVCMLDAQGVLIGAVSDMDIADQVTVAALQARMDVLKASDLIVVDANIPQESIEWLAAHFGKRRGGPFLVLDPVSATKARKAAGCIGSFDCVKPNMAEASVLTQHDASAHGNPGCSCCRMDRASSPPLLRSIMLASQLRTLGLPEAFISMGADGLYYEGENAAKVDSLERGRVGDQPLVKKRFGSASSCETAHTKDQPPVNVSGAGDAACAVLAWGLLKGIDREQRARYAFAAAALTAGVQSPVHPQLTWEKIETYAQGVIHESLS